MSDGKSRTTQNWRDDPLENTPSVRGYDPKAPKPDGKSQTTPVDEAERLIVERLQRYAARTRSGVLKADKVIRIVRERCEFIRTGAMPTHDAGRGERSRLKVSQ